MTGKLIHVLARATEKTKFLIICKYLNLVKYQKIILQQLENSQVVTTLKILLEKYMLFSSELYMKQNLLSALKGNYSYKYM